MPTLVTDFEPVLRALLGDHWAPYEYDSTVLGNAVVAALKLRKAPAYAPSVDLLSITPDMTVDDFAKLALHVGRLIVAPEREYSYSTRAISERFKERRNFLQHLEGELNDLENSASGGTATGFSSFTNFRTWLIATTGLPLGEIYTQLKVDQPFESLTVSSAGLNVG